MGHDFNVMVSGIIVGLAMTNIIYGLFGSKRIEPASLRWVFIGSMVVLFASNAANLYHLVN